MAEEEFRRLQAELERRAHPPSENADEIDKGRAFTADLKVSLLGRDFPLRPDGGLIALLTYCARGLSASQEDRTAESRQHAAMAAMFDLLAESVTRDQWPRFQDHALSGKASIEDVETCIRQVIEAYTARPYWPGLRLLAGAASQMAELDGTVLMGTGRGIATFTAREVCNLQLARLLAGARDEDTREVLLEDLYLDWSPEGVALGQVEQMKAAKLAALAAEEADGRLDAGDPAEDHGDPAVDDPAG